MIYMKHVVGCGEVSHLDAKVLRLVSESFKGFLAWQDIAESSAKTVILAAREVSGRGGPAVRPAAADFPRDVCLTVSRNHAVFLWYISTWKTDNLHIAIFGGTSAFSGAKGTVFDDNHNGNMLACYPQGLSTRYRLFE